jgi:hypothetical protein
MAVRHGGLAPSAHHSTGGTVTAVSTSLSRRRLSDGDKGDGRAKNWNTHTGGATRDDGGEAMVAR